MQCSTNEAPHQMPKFRLTADRWRAMLWLMTGARTSVRWCVVLFTVIATGAPLTGAVNKDIWCLSTTTRQQPMVKRRPLAIPSKAEPRPSAHANSDLGLLACYAVLVGWVPSSRGILVSHRVKQPRIQWPTRWGHYDPFETSGDSDRTA
jgi:hypothetical protein